MTDDKLELLLVDGIIDCVVGRLRGGKEADVWLVEHAGEVVAAKIYKDRLARSFRNNADYKEGRQVADSRTQRAMTRGSRFGQAAAEQAWKSAEADALYKLHAAGVRTPAPVMFFEGVLLMQLLTDAEGNAAPRLIDAQPTAEQACELYRDLRSQVVRMLAADLIHGDLSPYNVLLAAGGPTIIDFPQTIAAAHNSRAEFFFTRDLENLRTHLAGFAPELRTSAGDAREIWRAYVRRELTPEFVPTGRVVEDRPAHAEGKPAHAEGRPAHAENHPAHQHRRPDQRRQEQGRRPGDDQGRRPGPNPPRQAAPGPRNQQAEPRPAVPQGGDRRQRDQRQRSQQTEPRPAVPQGGDTRQRDQRQRSQQAEPRPAVPQGGDMRQRDQRQRNQRAPDTRRSGPNQPGAQGRFDQRQDTRPPDQRRPVRDGPRSGGPRSEQRPPQPRPFDGRAAGPRPRSAGPVVERVQRLAEPARPVGAPMARPTQAGSAPGQQPRGGAGQRHRRRSGGAR